MAHPAFSFLLRSRKNPSRIFRVVFLPAVFHSIRRSPKKGVFSQTEKTFCGTLEAVSTRRRKAIRTQASPPETRKGIPG
jgi:hypothetical protein